MHFGLYGAQVDFKLKAIDEETESLINCFTHVVFALILQFPSKPYHFF